MTTTAIGQGIGEALSLHPPWIISRQFHAFNMDSQSGRFFDVLRCSFHPLGKDAADPFPLCNEGNEFENRFSISKGEIYAPGLLL